MTDQADLHLLRAARNLRELLNDTKIPPAVRAELEADYQQVEAMTEKLTRGDLHLAVFGKVSAGKSSLLNALAGKKVFSTSALHGETRQPRIERWTDAQAGGIHLIDTPGINELNGEAREKMAYEVAERSDLVLFILDGDMNQAEREAIETVVKAHRPIIVVLNKIDRYTRDERAQLLAALTRHCDGLVRAENIVAVAADPRPQTVLTRDEAGNEVESLRPRVPDIEALRVRIWDILEKEGKTLAALNAALFAGRLTDQVSTRIIAARRDVAERITRTYSLTKGVAVALNPVPVADLLAAATLDIALVSQLSRVYGVPLSHRESGRLLATIVAQLALLMGAVWSIHLVSTALKTVSAGLSITLTGAAQGALAYYATYLVGRAAEQYFANGRSWGPDGPKQTVRDIVKSLDRNSILADARGEILKRLKSGQTG